MSQISRLKEAEIANGNLINADDIDAELNQLVGESNNQDTRLTELESSAMTIAGVKTFSSAPKMDQIDERSTDTGVTVDAVLLKDGMVKMTGVARTDGQIGYDSEQFQGYRDGNLLNFLMEGDVLPPPSQITGPAPTYTSASTITIPAGMVATSDDGSDTITIASALVVDLSASGALGLDTGSEASNTWYYVWLCKGASGVTAIFSASGSSPTLPSGYDVVKRRLNIAVRNDGSGDILPFQVMGGWPYTPRIIYTESVASSPYRVISAGSASSYTDIDLSSLVPPISKSVDLWGYTTAGSDTSYFFCRADGSSATGVILANVTNTKQAWNFPNLPTSASQVVEYKRDAGSSTIDIVVHGYTVTEVA